MKKKIILAAVAAAMVITMTACGSNTTTPVTTVTEGTMEIAELNANGLDGLGDYLKGNGVIGGDPIEMKAEIIGAKAGKKYGFKFNDSTIIVEIYEFDLKNLDDTGKATLDSVKENGSFLVLEKEVAAKISNSGKYVMIYTDNNTDDANVAQAQKAERLFQEYDEKESQIKVDATKKDEAKGDDASSGDTASSSEASSEDSSAAE